MKIVTIVGARPQFIKAAALGKELRREHEEVLVHTGQHYDYGMSGAFFDGLDLPAPAVNLGVGSGPHGAQTGLMLQALEKVLADARPDWVVVFGDTNSTLAGALAASKLHIRVAHIEAGLRSFNRRMPEEINRIVADHVSDLLLCPSQTAVANLAREGITRRVYLVGDIMQEVHSRAREQVAASPPTALAHLGLREGGYLLATVHRSENTDVVERLSGILEALNAVEETIVFPVHPRTRKALAAARLDCQPHVKLVDPLGYFEMVALAKSARLILTDSGGLQKEAYWLGVPCLTLRQETEWIETVEAGWNRLVGTEPRHIVEAVRSFRPPASRDGLYGNGRTAARCVELLNGNNQ